MRWHSNNHLSVVGLAAVLAVLLEPEVVTGDDRETPRSGGREFSPERRSSLPLAVRTAIRDAHRRLDDPRCRLIFSEFQDASGHTLQERLDSMGQTGQSYPQWMLFYDGRDGRPCRDANVLAMTAPGSRVVFFCGPQFAALLRRSFGTLAGVVLHEELHSLGLGENPPSSAEIGQAVMRRCGS